MLHLVFQILPIELKTVKPSICFFYFKSSLLKFIIKVLFIFSLPVRTNDGSKNEVAINLGTIEVKHFIADDYWRDEIEKFEMINVKSVDSVTYKKAGEYIPRSMNRLMPVVLKQ